MSASDRRRRRILDGLGILETAGPDVKDGATTGGLWSDDPRGDDKAAILRYLRNHPEGVPVSKVVRDVLGVDDGDTGPKYQSEYKFVSRFVDDCPVLLIDRRQSLNECHPAPGAFYLTSPKHYSNTDAVGRFADSGGETRQFPREFARDFISARGFDEMTSDRARVIERQFVSYLEQIDGKYNILEAIRDHTDPQYLLKEYRTLYNSARRANDNWRRYHTAWENATRQYDSAVFLTLTTDPSRFDNIQDMADATSDNFNRLMSWMQRRLADRCDRLGETGHNLRSCPDCEAKADRPDYIKVLEWTEKGRPHLHVIIFGHEWIAPQSEISRHWGKYQAEVVDVRSARCTPVSSDQDNAIETDDGCYKWLSKAEIDGETKRKDEKAHLGKYLSKQMPHGESVEELQDRITAAEDGDEDCHLWKTALYWVTGKRFWTSSVGIKPETEPEPFLTEYKWVGCAQYKDIPLHVLRDSQFDRPPPDRLDEDDERPA